MFREVSTVEFTPRPMGGGASCLLWDLPPPAETLWVPASAMPAFSLYISEWLLYSTPSSQIGFDLQQVACFLDITSRFRLPVESVVCEEQGGVCSPPSHLLSEQICAHSAVVMSFSENAACIPVQGVHLLLRGWLSCVTCHCLCCIYSERKKESRRRVSTFSWKPVTGRWETYLVPSASSGRRALQTGSSVDAFHLCILEQNPHTVDVMWGTNVPPLYPRAEPTHSWWDLRYQCSTFASESRTHT